MTSAKCNELSILPFFLRVSFFSLQTWDQELGTGPKKERCLQEKSQLLCALLLSTLLGFALLITYITMTCALGIMWNILFPDSLPTLFIRSVPLSACMDYYAQYLCEGEAFRKTKKCKKVPAVKKADCSASSLCDRGEISPRLSSSDCHLISLGPAL